MQQPPPMVNKAAAAAPPPTKSGCNMTADDESEKGGNALAVCSMCRDRVMSAFLLIFHPVNYTLSSSSSSSSSQASFDLKCSFAQSE
jgi:hypothetical protein